MTLLRRFLRQRARLSIGVPIRVAMAASVASLLPTMAPAQTPAPAKSAVEIKGTAYLKTRDTMRYAGKPAGPARMGIDAIVVQCNAIRAMRGLPAQRPPDGAFSGADDIIKEKYFAGDRALTLSTGTVFVLPDLQRFSLESKANPLSARPPDCAQYRADEQKSGTLWRDGVRYELRFASAKAIGSRLRHLFEPRTLMAAAEWERLPKRSVAGQTCRDVSTPPAESPFIQPGKTCIWDVFPYVGTLNWPFALEGEVRLGPTGGLVQTTEPLEAWSGRAIDAAMFEVPAGFAITVHD